MLQIIDIKKENVIVSVATGNLHQKDIEKIHPLIHGILEKDLKIRWYLKMHDFESWSINGFWQDLKKNTAHEKEFEKIAIVAAENCQQWVTQFMKSFTNADIRRFDLKQTTEAENWIKSE